MRRKYGDWSRRAKLSVFFLAVAVVALTLAVFTLSGSLIFAAIASALPILVWKLLFASRRLRFAKQARSLSRLFPDSERVFPWETKQHWEKGFGLSGDDWQPVWTTASKNGIACFFLSLSREGGVLIPWKSISTIERLHLSDENLAAISLNLDHETLVVPWSEEFDSFVPKSRMAI